VNGSSRPPCPIPAGTPARVPGDRRARNVHSDVCAGRSGGIAIPHGVLFTLPTVMGGPAVLLGVTKFELELVT
jgi:hypothetical protein